MFRRLRILVVLLPLVALLAVHIIAGQGMAYSEAPALGGDGRQR